MKRNPYLFRALLFCLILPCYVQGQINYGSNKGKYLVIRGTKLYYEEYGHGTPLLLLHGGFGNMADFSKCIPGLSAEYRVIAADAPGLGRSEFPNAPLSYQLIADYFSALVDQLKLDSVYVLGWSDGGIEGYILAHDRPDKVKKLMTSGANYKLNGYMGSIDEAKATIMNPAWVEVNMKGWVDQYVALSPQDDWKRYIEESKKMWFSEEYFPKRVLEELKIPVLICYGDHDMVSPEHGLEMRNAVSNSQYCILPNTSHSVFSEKPKLIHQIAMDFFKGR